MAVRQTKLSSSQAFPNVIHVCRSRHQQAEQLGIVFQSLVNRFGHAECSLVVTVRITKHGGLCIRWSGSAVVIFGEHQLQQFVRIEGIVL